MLYRTAQGEVIRLEGRAKHIEDNRFEIQLEPNHYSEKDLPVGAQVEVALAKTGSAITQIATVEAFDPPRKLFLQAQQLHEEPQKRDHFRVPADINIRHWEFVAPDRLSQDAGEGTARNISGGGILLQSETPLAEGSLLYLELSLEYQRKRQRVLCEGQVMHRVQGGRYYEHGIKFINLSEEQEEELMAFCFAQQRQLIRLQVETAREE